MTIATERAIASDPHAEAMREPVGRVAAGLQEIVGQRLAAVIAGVGNAKAVGLWARGERAPHPDAERRLRDAYHVSLMLLSRESPESVRAWFRGMNPHLDDEAPALAIADRPKEVVRAARTFLAHG